MSTKNIIVINGHPGQSSLSKSLCEAYGQAARGNGHSVRFHDISKMTFDMDYGEGGYQNTKPLEPELETFLADLEWADHVVLATPLWWGAIPAKLKGLFDRTLLPGRAFDPRSPNFLGVPAPLLKGRTARILMTSDTPASLLRLFYSNAIKKILSRQILGFVGIKPARYTTFAPATHADGSLVEKWLEQAARLGARSA